MKRAIICLLVLLLIASGCARPSEPDSPKAPWPTAEWHILEPEAQGLSTSLLQQMESHAANHRITNIMIVRNGYQVYHRFIHEEYMLGDAANLVPIYSCTKSIISALVGIALEQGHIESIDQKVSEFFPEWQALEPDSRRDAMTLEHVLAFTTGWDWPEFGAWNYRLDEYRESEDWLQFVLNREMVAPPGERFDYNSGASHLLSLIIHRATGVDTLTYARTNLFDPLGIGEVHWQQDPQGNYTGSFGLWMAAEDIARFGLLYLNEGLWEDNQIIPKAWVAKSTQKQSEGSPSGGGGAYGFQWWVTTLVSSGEPVEVYYALGFAGQFIYIVPDYDLVVVATSQNVDNPFIIRTYMENFILPPLVSH